MTSDLAFLIFDSIFIIIFVVRAYKAMDRVKEIHEVIVPSQKDTTKK